jgi:glycosyltransferase involved in cell wall biosynthesis
MRVLHAISEIDPRFGGTATAVTALARAQKRAGLDVSVFSTIYQVPAVAAAELLESEGIKVTQVGPYQSRLRVNPELIRALQPNIAAADVVHVHALWEQVQHAASRLAHAAGKPYVITPHGMLDPWSLNQSRWRKKLYLAWRMRRDLNEASAVHYTADAERDLAKPVGLTSPTIVEPNIVDLSDFDPLPSRGAFRARHPQLADKPIVLFLGRLHPKKGLELLIPAFAQAKLPEAFLVIAGPDPDNYSPLLRDLAARENVADRVLFTGMLRGRDRVEAFVDSDLFALPSYQENFGIAVVEALAAGCPVLLSDQVNIYREIVAGNVGSAVPTQIAPLAQELKRWMTDESARRAASSIAATFVRARYDAAAVAQRWVQTYATLSFHRSRSSPPIG